MTARIGPLASISIDCPDPDGLAPFYRALLGLEVATVDYPVDWIPRYSDAYRIELQEWINSITEGRPSTLASADDGLRAALVADALVESMRSSGAWIKVPDSS
jgi:hypothetical protein